MAPVAVEADVAFEGGAHRVRWNGAGLELVDHDLAAEAALEVLGGQWPCNCALIAQAWRLAAAHPATVAVGRRSIAQRWRADPGEIERARDALVSPSNGRYRARVALAAERDPVRRAEMERTLGAAEVYEQLPLVYTLPEALTDRLQLEALAAAETKWGDIHASPRVEPYLRAAVVGRALQPAESVFGCEVRVTALPPDGRPAMAPTGGIVGVHLPVTWPRTVWAAGLAVVDGMFTLSANWSRRDGTCDLELVDHDLHVHRRSLNA